MKQDIDTFFQSNASMFEEILKRYNDKGDYKYKPIVGQKMASTSAYSGVKKGVKTSTTPVVTTPTPIPPDPPKTFTTKSAWADLTATVKNYHTHFLIKVVSSTPAEKWFLEKDNSTHDVISSGGLNEQYNFVIDQPGNFVAGQMNLRIINTQDGQEYPSLFPLK